MFKSKALYTERFKSIQTDQGVTSTNNEYKYNLVFNKTQNKYQLLKMISTWRILVKV